MMIAQVILLCITGGCTKIGYTANIHSPVSELHTQFVAPPTELRVERVLQRGLVISWTLPNITALGDSNGIKIQGYQIFIDDLLNLTVLGCYQSKVRRMVEILSKKVFIFV